MSDRGILLKGLQEVTEEFFQHVVETKEGKGWVKVADISQHRYPASIKLEWAVPLNVRETVKASNNVDVVLLYETAVVAPIPVVFSAIEFVRRRLNVEKVWISDPPSSAIFMKAY